MLITCAFGTTNTNKDVYYRILNPDKSIYQSRINTDVTELVVGSGVYGVDVDDVFLNGKTVVWDIDGTTKSSSETFFDTIGYGSGATPRSISIKDDQNNPIGDAQVWITSDSDGDTIVAGYVVTTSNGILTFSLDAGVTYYIWTVKDGINFSNPYQVVSW